MSFLYPRTISIRRPNGSTGSQPGDNGYSADRGPVDEKQIASGLRASIQLDRQGQRNGEGLASDARYQAIWKVFIPRSDAAPGTIQDGDIVVDDLGYRRQCFAAWSDSLGYQLRAITLEV